MTFFSTEMVRDLIKFSSAKRNYFFKLFLVSEVAKIFAL